MLQNNETDTHFGAEGSLFAHGNELFRSGLLAEAFEVFSKLMEGKTGFKQYEYNYVMTKRRLAEDSSSNAALSIVHKRSATHPDSRDFQKNDAFKFTVVTPAYNAEKFIRFTIDSIISQEGDFFIDYIIKDGFSSDSTIEIVENVLEQVANGKLPLKCMGLKISLESSPDKGMYDAIRIGFEGGGESGSCDVLTYLNADDLYDPNAFRIAKTVFSETKAEWICGQHRTINESGKIINSVSFPLSYGQGDIANGLHLSGGSLYFIQQEGTFWKKSLYDRVGGVNPNLKLVGDFELWLKFAKEAELLALDRPLAAFRARPGQLSESFFAYRDEIEAHFLLSSKKSISCTPSEHALMGSHGPSLKYQQQPGPVCFLNDDLTIREVIYMKRAWVRGDNV